MLKFFLIIFITDKKDGEIEPDYSLDNNNDNSENIINTEEKYIDNEI